MNKFKSPLFYVGSLLLLVSLASSFVLSGTKLGVFDSIPGCGVGSGCDSITGGPWGTVPLIAIPVSFVGMAWFIGLFLGWLTSRFSSKTFLWFARIGALASVGFIIVMVSVGSFCKWCALVQACNLLFWATCDFGFNKKEINKSPEKPTNKDAAVLLVSFVISMVVLVFVGQMARAAKLAEDEKKSRENVHNVVSGKANKSTLALLEARHRIGPEDAPIQIVMFTDYQCPDCKRIETQLANIMKGRDDISVSVKHFPLCYECNDNIGTFKLHGNACWAARAAEAVSIVHGEDAWEKMHEWLFSQRGSFTDKTFSNQLAELGFDSNSVINTMMGNETLGRVKSDSNDGYKLGIYYTPMVFINGVEYLWYYGSTGSLVSVIDSVAEKIEQGDVETVVPPLATEKLVEDWRVGKARVLPGEENNSWRGDGPVEIVVWSDYQSEITKEIDNEIKTLLGKNPNVRYAYRHYPIDELCNAGVSGATKKYEGSCYLAKLVEAVGVLSGDVSRWKMHDWILKQSSPINLDIALERASSLSGEDAHIIQDVMGGIDVNNTMRADILSKNIVWRKSIPVVMIDGRFIPRWKGDGVTAQEMFQRILSIVESEAKPDDSSSK
ncbi:MAG: thioredoxin domain-containing protein [Phycisphaerales bacterium]|nr:thioredoxin domain-containing protein [Phycisphaerales bacterium]